ncbi:DUF4760 domain-containing protein [Candidatus Bathyarchaeota archaeon]|nr:DUF4760 domain-containing protein [Candidatus Bathyarchaeota archaeon]
MRIVNLTEISAIVATAGVLVGVVYYILAIQHQAQNKQTDLVMRLYATFSSTEFQNAWAKVKKRAREFDDIDDIYEFEEKVGGLQEFNQVGLFFEGVGILLKRRIVNDTLIDDLFGGAIARAWETVRTGIIKGRQQQNDPTIYYYFEYLYNEMKKREQTKKG